MPRNSSKMRPNAAATSRWSASSPDGPLRRAAAWAMPAPSSPAARAMPHLKSPRWKRPGSRSRRRQRGLAGRWPMYLKAKTNDRDFRNYIVNDRTLDFEIAVFRRGVVDQDDIEHRAA